jgi:hypothetical protein
VEVTPNRTYLFKRWIKQEIRSGVSRYIQLGSSEASWAPCWIIGYNFSKNKYLIQWKHSGKRKYVTRYSKDDLIKCNSVQRLNLQFDEDDPEQFRRRVELATKLRFEAESLLVCLSGCSF